MDNFTYEYYEAIFKEALAHDYQIITLKEFFLDEYDKDKKVLVNRIDVDFKIARLRRFYKIFKKLGIRASIYFRLHAPEYNLLSIGNIKIIQDLISIGCEVALHTELEDVGGYCQLDKQNLLRKEIAFFEIIFECKLYGTASHGDITPYNNLNFWKTNSTKDFGLVYEAYDDKLWKNCRYVSDSEWTGWKAYENGELIKDDKRTPIEHMKEGCKVLHILTHPESWYDRYIYE